MTQIAHNTSLLDQENPLAMFMYALRAPESKRQYPKRLKVFLDFLTSKNELSSSDLENQCIEFMTRSQTDPKWANNKLMDFVLYQKERVYPSFRSCMLRIPITINSKNDKVVQIIREWNGCRPQLTKELFVLFEDYLIQKKIEHELLQEKIFKERLKNKKRKQIGYNISNNCHQSNYYEWIEKLLHTPLEDYRKNAVSLILSTYLINIKKKSYEDSFVILKDWLDRCYKLKRLDFNAGYLIKYSLNTALKNKIPPMKLETIKERNYELYKIIIGHEKSK